MHTINVTLINNAINKRVYFYVHENLQNFQQIS